MSAKPIDDGGAAFPVSCSHDGIPLRVSYPNVDGMTLRDWFAGQALSRLASEYKPNAAASWAYQYADAMIAARKGGAE